MEQTVNEADVADFKNTISPSVTTSCLLTVALLTLVLHLICLWHRDSGRKHQNERIEWYLIQTRCFISEGRQPQSFCVGGSQETLLLGSERG